MSARSVVAKIPPDLLDILRKKTSRDTIARFSNKLHILLTLSTNSPETEEEIGALWITDTQFRINKPIICEILEQKVNTLNINIRAAGFIHLVSDREHWVNYTKPGFTKDSPVPIDQNTIISNYTTEIDEVFELLSFEYLSDQEVSHLKRNIAETWSILAGRGGVTYIPSSIFLPKAAEFFRHPNQQPLNAIVVLSDVLTPDGEIAVTLGMFSHFMAHFGPPETLMDKVKSLLDASAQLGYCYYACCASPDDGFFVRFGIKEPSVLQLRCMGGSLHFLVNIPSVPAGQCYIRADNELFQSYHDYLTNVATSYLYVKRES